MKLTTIVGVLTVLVVLGVWILKTHPLQQQDYKNITYTIEGERVALVNGKAETDIAPGSASKVVTEYFGNEATGDINADGIADVAFLLTQNRGGSGTFYYVVGAVQGADGGYEGTSAVLLGDRIAPQTTEIRDGQVIVNYADRAIGESFSIQPSLGKSLFLKLDIATMQFGEVVQDFEGEADPARMTLTMQTWTWIKTLYNNDTTIVPQKTKAFTLIFKTDGTFSATTDCNGVGGVYTVKDNTIAFSKMMSTLMYCDDSQESEFTKMLEATQSYLFTSKGELVLDLKYDTGSVIFR